MITSAFLNQIFTEYRDFANSNRKKLEERLEKNGNKDKYIELSHELKRGGYEEISTSGLGKILGMYDQGDHSKGFKKKNVNLEGLVIKYGIDPSKKEGATIAHLATVYRLRELQDLGATIQLVLGTETATIGDPSGKTEERNEVPTIEKTIEYSKNTLKALAPVLDLEKTNVVLNHEIYDQMSVEGFDYITKNFSFGELTRLSNIKARAKKGGKLRGSTVLYSVLQGIDSLVGKYTRMGAGGIDQKGNEMVGRYLQDQSNLEQQALLLCPIAFGTDYKLIKDVDGNEKIEKMGKSTNNFVSLGDPVKTYSEIITALKKHKKPHKGFSRLIDNWAGIYTNVNTTRWNPFNLFYNIKSKNVAKKMLTSYYGKDLTKKAIRLFKKGYEESNLKIENLEEQVDEVFNRKNDQIYEFLNKIPKTEINELTIDGVKLRGSWSKEQIDDMQRSYDKSVIVHLNARNNSLHIGEAALLQSLNKYQEKGYHVKVIIGDYTTGFVKNNEKSYDEVKKNAEKIEKQIKELNLVDNENLTIIRNSAIFENMNISSLLELYKHVGLLELEKKGLVSIRNPNDEVVDERKFSPGTTVLDTQYRFRKAIGYLLTGNSEDTIIINTLKEDKSIPIYNHIVRNMGLKQVDLDNLLTIEGAGQLPMNYVNNSVALINNADNLYSNLMGIREDAVVYGSKEFIDNKGIKSEFQLSYEGLKVDLEDLCEISKEGKKRLSKINDHDGNRKIVENQMNAVRSIVQKIHGAEAAIEAENNYFGKDRIELNPEHEYSIFSLAKKVGIDKDAIDNAIKRGILEINGDKITDNRYKLELNPGEEYKIQFTKNKTAIFTGK